jgi:hypothetical protein
MKKIEAIQMEMIVGGEANEFWQGFAVGALTVGGAITGGIAGFVVGGPPGAVIGAVGGGLTGLGTGILAL